MERNSQKITCNYRYDILSSFYPQGINIILFSWNAIGVLPCCVAPPKQILTVTLSTPLQYPNQPKMKLQIHLKNNSKNMRTKQNWARSILWFPAITLSVISIVGGCYTGNSSCDDYILLILELHCYAHDPCATNWVLIWLRTTFSI